MGAGRSIAVQNFNEQACILALGFFVQRLHQGRLVSLWGHHGVWSDRGGLHVCDQAVARPQFARPFGRGRATAGHCPNRRPSPPSFALPVPLASLTEWDRVFDWALDPLCWGAVMAPPAGACPTQNRAQHATDDFSAHGRTNRSGGRFGQGFQNGILRPLPRIRSPAASAASPQPATTLLGAALNPAFCGASPFRTRLASSRMEPGSDPRGLGSGRGWRGPSIVRRLIRGPRFFRTPR